MKILIIVALFTVISQFAYASSYFVSEINTSDANPELAKSLRTIVITSVVNAGGSTTDSDAASDFVLKTDLIRLGQAYVLTVTKVKKGSPVYSSRQKASTVEDLDDAADRAVRAAILSTPTKTDVRLGEVKPREEEQLKRRIQTRNTTYLGFGPGNFTNIGASQISYDLALGHNWEVTPNAAIFVLGNLVTAGDFRTYYAMGQLGLHYFFTDEDSAPYVGAGLGFGGAGSAASTATSIGGFAGSAGIGWQFFRTTTTQFDLYASYESIFGNNTIGAPGVYSLRVGVLF